MVSLRSRLGLAPETVYLMDGSAFVFRAFYALQNMARSDGFPTNILFIVTRLLLKILREEQPTYFSFILDGKGPTHRNALYKEYKANRRATPESLILQLQPLLSIIEHLGISYIVSEGCEADDCIASLADRLRNSNQVVIIGADKDLKQCLDKNVILWDPAAKEEKIITLQSFQESTGMSPSSWPDYQALVGDSSDNIPGIPKIGPKTAETLIRDFPKLEDLFSRLPAVPPKIRSKLEGQQENAFLYRKLTTLERNICANVSLETLARKEASITPVADLLNTYELRALVKEISSMERAGVWNKFANEKIDQPTTNKEILELNNSKPPIESPAIKNITDPPSKIKAVQEKSLLSEITELSFETCSDISTLPPPAEMTSILPLKDGILYATENKEILYTGDIENLAQLLKRTESLLITPDMKLICKLHKELWDIPQHRWYDLSLAAYLLSPEDRSYSWEHLSHRLGEQSASMNMNNPGFLALDICKYLQQRLSGADLNSVLQTIEMPLVPILASMENKGITIDKTAFSSFLADVQKDLDRLTVEIHEMAGENFNIRSSQQLSDILFIRLELPKAGKTKGGAMSTSQASLEKLIGKHPIIDALLEYRKLEKLRSTYLDPLPLAADFNGRIHTTFNQTATATGRLSSSNPNMQNIPIRGSMGSRMRACFIAEQGKKIVCADYSQIELRVLAHLSQDPTLLESFHDNEDIHARTAALLFDVQANNVTQEQRRSAKTINFGLIYGMGAQKLAQELRISLGEAKKFIERYFSRLSKLKEFYDSIEREAKEFGYVATMTGRRRLTPDILSENSQLRSQARRQAINTRIQGSAADIIKLAMIAVNNDAELKAMGANLLLQIHDELVMEVDKEKASEAGKRLSYIMEAIAPKGHPLTVPLLVEWGIGNNWSESH